MVQQHKPLQAQWIATLSGTDQPHSHARELDWIKNSKLMSTSKSVNATSLTQRGASLSTIVAYLRYSVSLRDYYASKMCDQVNCQNMLKT